MSLLESLAEAQLHPGAASTLIPSGWQPATDVAVDFDGVQLRNGNLLRVSQVQKAPGLAFKAESGASPEALYTFMLIDPDAPTPADPKFAFWRHWVVRSVKPGVNVSGKTLTEFLAPGPKPDSDPHRYLFLVFREPTGFSIEKEDVGGEEFVQRRSFGAAEFIQKHGLTLVGLNWMRCAADEWSA